MKRFVASMMLATLVVCAVASIMMQPARAEIIVFTAQLLAANETPPVTNADQNASGSVIVTLDTVNNTARFDFSVNGLAASTVILAHIHEGPAGVAGPIRVDSGITPGSPLTVVNGSVVFGKSGIASPADVTQRLVANPAGFYFNVHSNLNPGGVVRGQLVRAQAGPGGTSAPTLSQWGMILMTLLMLSAGVFFLVARRPVATADGAIVGTVSGSALNWRRFASVVLTVELIIAVALLALSASVVDEMGGLAAGLIIAYIILLLIGAARKD